MMGGVSPETCWASYKYEINFDTLLHLAGFFIWIILWCTDARTSNNTMITVTRTSNQTMMHGCTNFKLYYDTRMHEHQTILWCTDARTSNYTMMHGCTNIKSYYDARMHEHQIIIWCTDARTSNDKCLRQKLQRKSKHVLYSKNFISFSENPVVCELTLI
jgi:hypothetical protein